MSNDHHDDNPGLDVELLLRLSAQWLLEDPDRDRFMGKLVERAPMLFAEALTDDPELVRRAPMRRVLRQDAPPFFRSLGWTIASSMPLPGENWQPRRMPLPGRNDPCLCGSGAKFKHCCQALLDAAPRLDPSWLAALVVLAMPARDWPGLVGTRVPPPAVAAAAHDLMEADQPRQAQRLLEPWAKAPAPWPAAWVDLLDLLADLYLELGHPRKRRALAEAMVERGDTAVQSLGWQRLSMMAADAGDPAAARQAFEKAQRLTPDDPRVALLEVTTLLGTGEVDRAHERASFHARRLARLPHADALSTEIEGLQAIARGELDHIAPGAADEPEGFEIAEAPGGFFDDVAEWVQGLPPPKLRLDLRGATADDLGELRPDRAASPALKAWWRAFEPERDNLSALDGPEDEGRVLDVDRWLPLLKRQPMLLDCFEVLDALIGQLDRVPMGLAAGLQAALLLRARGLWELLRERFPQARCEWGWLDNRPALRLLARDIDLDTTPRAERSFEMLRALVEVLNPNDNQGLRERLGAVLLRRGDTAAALALAERYPDDFVGMRLLHVRALLAAQRLDEARTVFDAAVRANPHLVKLLKASRPPRADHLASFRVGSAEEAKIAIANQHDLWRDKALQQWLAGKPEPDAPVQLTLT